MVRADNLELAERNSDLSLIQDVATAPYQQVKSPNDYLQVKTPDVIEDGALRKGGAPNIYGREHIGVLIQYGGCGLVYSCIYGLTYPFLNNYLRMSGVATASASVLTALPWTLKLFFGIVQDCWPIFGYRRRPYMVIGWVICTLSCLIMACLPLGDPYYPDSSWAYLTTSELSQDQIEQINYDAPGNGTKFIILMIIADLGMVISFTAVGGTIVELSQQEPENVRGQLQTMIWVSRVLFGIVSTAMIGFGLNSDEYGGDFSGSMGVNAVMGVATFVSVLSGLSSWWCITEEKTHRRSVIEESKKLFNLMQLRIVYQVLAFQFFKNMFAYVSNTATYPIQSVWAKVTTLNSSVSTIIASLIGAGALLAVNKYGLNWNWRWMIVITQLSVVFIDMIPTFLTVWDVYRSQWFWLGVPLLETVPSYITFIVSTFCMVEVMEEGNEAAFYGLMVAISSLASPFSTVITKNIDSNFDISTADLQEDTHYVRTQVTYAYLCMYACNIFSCVFVLLLPNQKAECQELKRTGGKSKAAAVITVIILAFVYEWSIMTNLMSIFPSTSCLVIAGGTGC